MAVVHAKIMTDYFPTECACVSNYREFYCCESIVEREKASFC